MWRLAIAYTISRTLSEAIARHKPHEIVVFKQTFLGQPTNVCLGSFVFAEFFPKTGKATFGNSA